MRVNARIRGSRSTPRTSPDKAEPAREGAMTIRYLVATLLALFASSAVDRPADAQSYPSSRPVKIIVPYAPGGPNDIMARILAQKLTEALGGSFIVENSAGGGGTIGTGTAANAPGDGHTLLVANQDLIVQPTIRTRVPYDPVKSFAPLSMLVASPETITVHPSVPAKDVKELIELLKANPGKYSYASPGYGTTPHLAMTWLLKLKNGIDVTHVPFQGGAPAMQSVLGGQTPVFHMVLPVVAPHIKAGTIRALAVTDTKRSPILPDVPTIGEAGYPGHEIGFWMGVYATAGTPKNVLDVLQAQVVRIMTLPDVKERIATMGFEPTSSTPEQLAAHMRAETEKWSKIVREANIKIE
jgi:tripartite-type tricarboxylate transporter receptor subunit TctC